MSTPTWLPLPDAADAHETFRGGHEPPMDPTMEPTAIQPYVVMGELGHGGMGSVHLARQTRLGRDVAVKRSLRPEAESLILAEASITGRLEHPNIVPVYDLATPEAGPQLVMKRIEGTVWEDLISGVRPLPDDTTDAVTFHLEVLVEVCQAIAFAHDRGFLHRDIKPSNVMVGSFGEVYVMDWGLAVRTERTPSGRLVDLVGQRHMQGTPAYMPPEMFVAEGPVGVGSDTYLLGATLWQILAGEPPRTAVPLAELRDLASRPVDPPASWPRPLRRLLMQAMDPEPVVRPTVLSFRDALRRYLATRSSERLLEEARTLVDEVERAETVPYEAFGAARFVLRDVQRTGAHPDAEALEQRLVVGMIRRQLAAENPGAAQALLAEAEVPNELRREVEQAVAHQQSLLSRLVTLETRLDQRTFAGARLALALLLGTSWVGIPLALPLLGMERGITWSLVHAATNSAALLIGVSLLWRRLWGSSINWGMVVLVGLSPVYTVALAAVAWFASLSPDQLTPVRAVTDGTIMLAASLLFDLRLTPMALAYLMAGVASAAFPAYATLILVPATILLLLYTIPLWGVPALRAWRKSHTAT